LHFCFVLFSEVFHILSPFLFNIVYFCPKFISPTLFVMDFFEIGFCELFVWAGFKPWSSWSFWVARITGVSHKHMTRPSLFTVLLKLLHNCTLGAPSCWLLCPFVSISFWEFPNFRWPQVFPGVSNTYLAQVQSSAIFPRASSSFLKDEQS
jgi:hypothetical protein